MRRIALVAPAALLALACNAVLGLDPQHLRAEAGAPPPDAGGGDVAAPDAAPDAAADASAYAREVLADKPLLYLRLGEAGGTIAYDEEHTFDATYPDFGVTFKVQGALVGDPDKAVALGGQSKITLPRSADFAGSAKFSVEIWLKPDPAMTGLAFLIDHELHSSPSARDGWDITVEPTAIGFERYSAGGGNASVSAPGLAPGAWSHLLFTWDGSTERIFVNGTRGGESGTVSLDIDAVPGGYTLGGLNCSCSNGFYLGALDELAIYDHVLAGDRLMAHLAAAGR